MDVQAAEMTYEGLAELLGDEVTDLDEQTPKEFKGFLKEAAPGGGSLPPATRARLIRVHEQRKKQRTE